MKKLISIVLLSSLILGCTSTDTKKIHVIQKEDIPVEMKYDGIDGYWISKSRMMVLFEIAERYEQLLKQTKPTAKK